MTVPILFFTVILLCLPFSSTAAVDGVVATVDDHAILLSELNEITHLALLQDGKKVSEDSPLFAEKRRTVLGRIIDDRILLARAKIESVEVLYEEVEELVQKQIKALSLQYGSLNGLEQALESQFGLTLAKLKKQYRRDIRDNLIKQRFRENLFRKSSITREEVLAFYTAYKDSLPTEQASVNLSHIVLFAQPDQKIEQKARQKLETVKQRLENGETFEALAVKLSDDLTAKDSGYVGAIRRGGLGLPEFETAAFNLNPGDVSPIVRTKIGYHLIKAVKKTDRQVWVRHILSLVQPAEAQIAAIKTKLDSIRKTVKDSVQFALTAKAVSQDANTKDKGGYLGWYTRERLVEEYGKAIAELEPGQMSEPVEINQGYHIFRLNQASQSREMTINNDYAVIENLALANKVKQELEQKLKLWRTDFYVENHLSEFEE